MGWVPNLVRMVRVRRLTSGCCTGPLRQRISQAETSLARVVIAAAGGRIERHVYAPESAPKSASRHTLRYRFCAFPRTYSGSRITPRLGRTEGPPEWSSNRSACHRGCPGRC